MIRIAGIRYGDEDAPEETAQVLLCGVEYEMSALLFFDMDGACMGVRLFDTAYRRIELPLPRGVHGAWLMSGHPFGDEELSERDMRGAEELCAALGRENVRLFIAGQEAACREMQIPE